VAVTLAPEPAQGTRRSLRSITVVLAVSCGLAVANIYYAQPLLDMIATSFRVTQGAATLAVTMAQLGYAAGLVLLLPLGDLMENRALAARTLLVTAAALVGAALAPGFAAFLTLLVVIGLTSVVAQILVPFAAHLAPAETRGRVVGGVMTGLLLGILLARTASSFIAAAWDWQAVFLISAVLMVGTAGLLWRVLPRRQPEHVGGYRVLMVSIVDLIRTEPVVRRRAATQALMFGAFSAFWTSVAFELIRAHGLNQTQIGIFALIGAAGAVAAPLAGWLGDKGYDRIGTGLALVLAVVAMLVAWGWSSNLIVLAVAGIALDFAVQANHILNQRVIYGLRAEARARINTVYMGTIFIGGAIATAVSGLVYDRYDWYGVTALAAALPLVGLILWATTPKPRPAKSGRHRLVSTPRPNNGATRITAGAR
jgi:predicted MFS family arabinose efflux permease